MLEVAEQYLDELAHRSLVQVEPWGKEGMSWSKFEQCRVHDLIRELCLTKVKEEKVIKIIDLPHKPDQESKVRNKRVRRLCIHSSDMMDESTVDKNLIPQIRSLLLFEERDHLDEKIFSFEKYKLLRVLTLQGLKLKAESLESIGKLVYPKYLSIKGCEMVGELPSSIGNLRNLETLDLRVSDPSEIRIPNVIGMFKQLNHLYLPVSYLVARDQEKVRLDGLNKLEVIGGFDSVYCEAQDLIKLSEIKVFEGSIRVDEENPRIIENTIDFIKSEELSYSALSIYSGGREVSCLVSLLECGFIDNLYIRGRITGLPKKYEHNCFSGRLTNIELINCEIEEIDPMILLEKLPNLRNLSLDDEAYMGREMVCSAMGFPQLQSLELWNLTNLTNWRVDKGAMRKLSYLQICRCNKLEMLPDGLTALKRLRIRYMPTAFGDRIRVTDKGEGPDFYKVRDVSVTLENESN